MSSTFVREDERPHVDSLFCGKCRKPFLKGHRCIVAHIFLEKGVNPEDIFHMGAMLSSEFELVHVDCHDPLLKKGVRNAS